MCNRPECKALACAGKFLDRVPRWKFPELETGCRECWSSKEKFLGQAECGVGRHSEEFLVGDTRCKVSAKVARCGMREHSREIPGGNRKEVRLLRQNRED